MTAADLIAAARAAARHAHARYSRFAVGAAVLFGVVEIAAGLMPTYLTYAVTVPLLGLAATLAACSDATSRSPDDTSPSSQAVSAAAGG